MSKVVKFPDGGVEANSVTDVFAEGLKVDWETVVIVGHSTEGELHVISSDPHGGMVLWLFEQGKLYLLGQLDEDA